MDLSFSERKEAVKQASLLWFSYIKIYVRFFHLSRVNTPRFKAWLLLFFFLLTTEYLIFSTVCLCCNITLSSVLGVMFAQKQINDIKALFSCRYTYISYLLMASPGVNVFPFTIGAEIANVFSITICVEKSASLWDTDT